jgi:nucleoside-triphosphatase
LLLTGRPGVGKTTVLREVAARLAQRRLGGFYTEEMREHGQRVGFRLWALGGTAVIIAHTAFAGVPRVGKYGVDVAAIDRAVQQALGAVPRAEAYLVDEIGKMECLSERFVATMGGILDSSTPVVATVARSGVGFIEEVKRRPDATLWEVTPQNRQSLPARIADWLGRGLPQHA